MIDIYKIIYAVEEKKSSRILEEEGTQWNC